ncbi:retrovirus-related pol polyprotein from transposon TNT 1-94 [Tanacetum coccineum]
MIKPFRPFFSVFLKTSMLLLIVVKLLRISGYNRLIVVPGIDNQNPNRNGNVVAARAEGNAIGNNGNQIRHSNKISTQPNNQRISSNPRNRQIAQPGMNMGQDRQMQMVRGNGGNQFRQYAGQNVGNQNGYNAVQNVRNQVVQNAVQNLGVQNVGNQNGLIVVPRIANQNPNGNGNVVAARAEGNAIGNNGNQIRCYNCRGLGHLARNCTVRPRRRDAAYLQTQLLIAQKEEAGIQLQAEEFDLMAAVADLDEIEKVNANCILMANLQRASTLSTQTDKSPVYNSDRPAEVHNYDNCYDNEIFNMVTQEEHVEQSRGTVEPYPATVKETRAYHKLLFYNLAAEVEKVNTVNRKMKETNAELTTELARYKNQEKDTSAKTRGHSLGAIRRLIGFPYASKMLLRSKIKKLRVEEHPMIYSQCLITANHDVCVLDYVNDMNFCGKKEKANVSNTEKKPKVMKPKKVGSNERLTSPKPSKPRSCLRWSPTGILFDLKGKINRFPVYLRAICALYGYPNLFMFLGNDSLWEYDHVRCNSWGVVDLHMGKYFDHAGFISLWLEATTCSRYDREDIGKNVVHKGDILVFNGILLIPLLTDCFQELVCCLMPPQVLQTLTATTITADTAPTPTNSSSQLKEFPNTSQDVNELKTQQQHVQQQNNQAPLQPEIVADNVSNAMFDGNTFVNPFAITPQVLLNHHLYNMWIHRQCISSLQHTL